MRPRSHLCTLALAGAILLPLFACLGPQPDREWRLWSVPLPAAGEQPPAGSGPLRLRTLSSAAHLREALVVREEGLRYSVLPYDRWTEPPVGWLRLALERMLFESGAFQRAEGSLAAALDVELLAFELLRGPEPAVECSFAVKLTGTDGRSLLDRTISVRRPIQSEDPARIASGLGLALELAVRDLAGRLAASGR
jgi:hypothetical protein